jgi:UDP-glucose 4-epimerase
MRVMVTGGAGYIGSVIAQELVDGGHDVLVLDNLSKGHADAVPQGATLLTADLHDTSALGAAFTSRGIEAVVHLAASSLVGESMQNPGKYYRENLGGGIALLDAMCGAGVRRLIFSSTAAVYGEPAKQPIEEADPLAPTNTYGETKLAFERALHWYALAHGLQHVSLRYFNAAGASGTHGERHNPETHLIPLVLQAAAGVRPEITIFGDDYATRDGTCVRDYVHVADLARAHVLALAALAAGDEPAHAYNLGCGGAGYSVHEVIATAQRVTGRPIPTRVAARRSGDPAVLVASSDRIRRELCWAPQQGDLESIVRSAWVWMQSQVDS